MTLQLVVDNPAYPISDQDLLASAMACAGAHLEDCHVGVSWRASAFLDLSFLPSSHSQPYHFLHADGGSTALPRPPSSWFMREDDDDIRPMHALYRTMGALKDMLHYRVVGASPVIDAIILRPRSLLVLRTASVGKIEPGALVVRSGLTGHEHLEEITAIQAAFPGRFDIETQP